MKTKLDLAHEYAMKHMVVSGGCITVHSLCGYAWNYADEMYKQLEERESKGVPEVVSSVGTADVSGCDHNPEYNPFTGGIGFITCKKCSAMLDDNLKSKPISKLFDTDISDWQPDWSQLPDNANYWAMDLDGSCNTYQFEPVLCGHQWDFGDAICGSPSFNYKGNWQASLRKRPEGK